ncbi:MAG: flagellar filament outer layer protein FlaA [Treponema sp.]|nr:flagellar filament outer layer protein FlaA [Treponema sp.]
MKRIIILVVIALVTAGMLIADEAVLIDFSNLTADIHVKVSDDDQDDRPNHNRQTIMDYAQAAGGSFTPEQKALMKTSLAIRNWDVKFNSSSQTVMNMANTYTREAPSKQWGTVMGVRVHYPVDQRYSKASIKPPFEIPAYEPAADVDDDGNIQEGDSDGITGPSRFEDGYGVVKNVGTIRSVAINAYGLNFPHGLNVILIDGQGNEKVCFMGYLNYDGWAELTWNNPQYIMEVRNRDLRLYPLYPTNTPFVKFGGLRLDRDADKEGGDFVAYFKDVKIIYDKAVLDSDRDIDDESIWSIINDRETAKKIFEMERFGQNQVLRYLDAQKQASEAFDPLRGEYGFTPTPTNEE